MAAHVSAGDFAGACRAMAVYEANQKTARGIGVDWANYSPSRDVAVLEMIHGGLPAILAHVDPSLPIEQGISLCKLGYPFHDIVPTYTPQQGI